MFCFLWFDRYGKGDTMIGGAAADIDGVDAAYDACSPFSTRRPRPCRAERHAQHEHDDDDDDGAWATTTATAATATAGNGDGSDNAGPMSHKFGGDLWALGIVLLELTSCHIFQVRTPRLFVCSSALR
jgi:hypothetical protein